MDKIEVPAPPNSRKHGIGSSPLIYESLCQLVLHAYTEAFSSAFGLSDEAVTVDADRRPGPELETSIGTILRVVMRTISHPDGEPLFLDAWTVALDRAKDEGLDDGTASGLLAFGPKLARCLYREWPISLGRRLMAAVGAPVHAEEWERVRQELAQQDQTLTDALLAAAWTEPTPDRLVAMLAIQLKDESQPLNVAAWNAEAPQAWREFQASLARALERELFGEHPYAGRWKKAREFDRTIDGELRFGPDRTPKRRTVRISREVAIDPGRARGEAPRQIGREPQPLDGLQRAEETAERERTLLALLEQASPKQRAHLEGVLDHMRAGLDKSDAIRETARKWKVKPNTIHKDMSRLKKKALQGRWRAF